MRARCGSLKDQRLEGPERTEAPAWQSWDFMAGAFVLHVIREGGPALGNLKSFKEPIEKLAAILEELKNPLEKVRIVCQD